MELTLHFGYYEIGMNYLGHAYFSTEKIFIGNMAGDSLIGVDVSALDEDLRAGISRHRLIDQVTDSHEAFFEIRSMFTQSGLPYAGVFADLAIDWGIASRWSEYSGVEWHEFKESVYRRLETGSRRIGNRPIR